MMRIEAISVCRYYSDFLQVAAEANRGLFDRWIVATSEDDIETRDVAKRFNLDVLITDAFTHNGQDFAKGRVIDQLLQQCSADSFRCHIDADIVLPTHFRNALASADLDPSCIYGWDRIMCRDWGQWERLRNSGWLSQQWLWHSGVRFPAGYEIGTRWASPEASWCPIGFSQLMHASAMEYGGIRYRKHPQLHGDACRTDVQLSMLWPVRKRILLPTVIAAHLESEPAKQGANWNGRTTKRFGPPGAPLAPLLKAKSVTPTSITAQTPACQGYST